MEVDLSWLKNDVILDDKYKLDELIDGFHDIACDIAKKLNFNKDFVVTNRWSIFAALQRYSRDIFGYCRLQTCLEKNGIEPSSLKKIMKEIKEKHKGLGLRIVSENPYIHKRMAFFLYHFSIMKPFALNFKGNIGDLNEKQVDNIIHFNSIVSLSCVQRFLFEEVVFVDSEKCRLLIRDNGRDFDKDFSHDLTYRSLNRSSLEAAMRYMIIPFPTSILEKKLEEYRRTKK